MKTTHRVYFQNSKRMGRIPSGSVDLVLTSPPYPMIAMWDDLFRSLNPAIGKCLEAGRGFEAFDLMHAELDPVWEEVIRVLKPGGLAAINIGDATRTVDNDFALYPNHARIQNSFVQLGLAPLPTVIWRKQTNAPNKFMGSGMLPPGAYVTLEHEYILLFRKGSKMFFAHDTATQGRRESAYFWEERNNWFSDVWMDLKGTPQKIRNGDIRRRSGAFPFELAFRIINMFSVKNACVLDPFLGTGTTMWAALASGRNSLGFELEPQFRRVIEEEMPLAVSRAAERLALRLNDHLMFVSARQAGGYAFKYVNEPYGFPVMTRQEILLSFSELVSVKKSNEDRFEAEHTDRPSPKNLRLAKIPPGDVPSGENQYPEKLEQTGFQLTPE